MWRLGYCKSILSRYTVEVAKQIKTIRKQLESREVTMWTPDQLSRAMTKLAILNMTLGEMVIDALGVYRDKETQRKVGLAQLELELSKDMSMTAARTQAQVKGLELYEQENRAEYEYKLLSTLYRDTESLISVLQSRLRHLGNEQYQQQNNIEQEAA